MISPHDSVRLKNTSSFAGFAQFLSRRGLAALVRLGGEASAVGLLAPGEAEEEGADAYVLEGRFARTWEELCEAVGRAAEGDGKGGAMPGLWDPREDGGDVEGGGEVDAVLEVGAWLKDDMEGGQRPAPVGVLEQPSVVSVDRLWNPVVEAADWADEGGGGGEDAMELDDEEEDHDNDDGGGVVLSSAPLHAPQTQQSAPASASASASQPYSTSQANEANSFYGNLEREYKDRSKSHIFHMRNFNNWVKAKLIAKTKPKLPPGRKGMNVLDLACGKGGDLLKWGLHTCAVSKYVGVDVAENSLKDASKRILKSNQLGSRLSRASLVAADLGSHVVGCGSRDMLLTWEKKRGGGQDLEFRKAEGGGVPEAERFDLVSCQFAIHYFLDCRERARRFFKTVGDLLVMGGSLLITTIDARVVAEKLMESGKVGTEEAKRKGIVVEVGGGEGPAQTTFSRLF